MRAISRRGALATGLGFLAVAGGPARAAPGVASPGDMSLGRADAPVKVVEYASASCNHCAHFNEEVFPTFKARHIDTGRVRYTVKELLTPPQQVAAAGFLLARCGSGGASQYFKILDEVFRSQSRWQSGQIKPIFVEIAKANGITEAQFDACLQDQAALQALNDRVREAIDDGITGTPTFFVDGKQLPGIPTLADLDAAIAAAGRR